jgi:hypothetical protein
MLYMINMAEEFRDAYISPSGVLFQVSNQGRIRKWLKTYLRWKPVKGCIDRHGYRTINGAHYKKSWRKPIHRLVAVQFVPNPEGKPFVDHIIRGYVNRSDNRAINLRWATVSQNQQNQDAKGCYFNKPMMKWQARIRIGGVQKHLGYYDTEAGARAVYLEAKMRLHAYYDTTQLSSSS